MIFKIIFNESVYFRDKIDFLTEIGEFCFNRNVYYVNTELTSKNILKRFEKIDSISQVNIYTSFESDMLKKWCIEKLALEELHSFERSKAGQEKLISVMNYLDEIEKRGDIIGEEKNGECSGAEGTSTSAETNKN